jgi:hypothetical protein
VRDEYLGYSTLQRFPSLLIEDRYYLALPTAVSIAIRRAVVDVILPWISTQLIRSCWKGFSSSDPPPPRPLSLRTVSSNAAPVVARNASPEALCTRAITEP